MKKQWIIVLLCGSKSELVDKKTAIERMKKPDVLYIEKMKGVWAGRKINRRAEV